MCEKKAGIKKSKENALGVYKIIDPVLCCYKWVFLEQLKDQSFWFGHSCFTNENTPAGLGLCSVRPPWSKVYG